MAEVTERNATNNQITFDYDRSRLLVRKYDTERKDYANISGAIETVVIGTVMGIVTATGKMVPCDSTATDGSQIPTRVLLEELDAIEIAGTVDSVLVVTNGELNGAKIVFQNGTDTLDTLVADAGGRAMSMRDWLMANSKGIELVAVEDSSEYDN